MLPIQDSRVSLCDGKWVAACECGKVMLFRHKATALRMVNRGTCRYCRRDYRNVTTVAGVYQNADLRWCSTCSGCGAEQAYTRKDHAKQSQVGDWQCRKCVAKAKRFSTNTSIGDEKRLYNKFRKSASSRGISWEITFEMFVKCYSGKCALTGWELDMGYGTCTASFDRIDSTSGYTKNNIQWVHTMVNMCKNKYSQEKFISMCNAVSHCA
jgi:hypothetical protein